MTRFKVLFALAALLSLIGFVAAAVATSAVNPWAAAKFNCCDDPTCCPGCCPECPPDCCPDAQGAKAEAFTCPLTGEELPCPNCCPLNQKSAQVLDKIACPPCPLCP
jgi:hypothetical protein